MCKYSAHTVSQPCRHIPLLPGMLPALGMWHSPVVTQQVPGQMMVCGRSGLPSGTACGVCAASLVFTWCQLAVETSPGSTKSSRSPGLRSLPSSWRCTARAVCSFCQAGCTTAALTCATHTVVPSAAQHGHPGVTQPQGQQSPYKQGAQTLFPFSLVQGLRAGLGCAIPVLQAASAPPEPPVFASAGRRAAQLQQAALCAARG